MKPDIDFLPPGSEPPVSAGFQDNVIARIQQHHRRKQRVINLIMFCMVLTASFYYQRTYRRTRDALREIPVQQDARVASAAKGVQWLVDSQNENGTWDTGNMGGNDAFSGGVSALATLALFNAPDPVNRDVLDKAVTSLEKSLEKSAPVGLEGPEFYNWVLTLNTLAEIEKQMPDPQRKALLKKSYTDLLRQQLADGGWGYVDQQPMGYTQNSTSNSAVTWWVCHLLKNRPSLNLQGVDTALLRGNQWLTDRRRPNGNMAYQTAANIVADHEDALFWMTALTGINTSHPKVVGQDAYRDYFRLAVVQPDADLKSIQNRQQENGSWFNPDDRWWQAGGKVYLTALSVLSQVPKGV